MVRVLKDKNPYLSAAFIVARSTLLFKLLFYPCESITHDLFIRCNVSGNRMVWFINGSAVRVINIQRVAKRAVLESAFHRVSQHTLVNSHNIL